MSEFKPKILAFLCNWCAYAAADSAGVSRLQYPTTIRVIRTMCSGRVDPLYVVKGLKSGFDSVFVSGWHIGECHYQDGNIYTGSRMQVVGDLLELSGIGRDRMQLRWASAAEGPLFADYVKQFSELTQGLGAFDLEKFKLPLAAVEQTLSASRIRWLLGMTRQLTEQGNVFHEKLKDDEYKGLLQQAIEEEYHKALVLGALKEGPRSVREISKKIGLPLYTVSLRLNDLEKRGQAELKGYDGSTPTFISLTA